jgi:hypothetical protein
MMAEPFIFIGTHSLKEGKFEDFKANCVALADVVEAEEPRMIAFNVYANENGTEVSVVQGSPGRRVESGSHAGRAAAQHRGVCGFARGNDEHADLQAAD